MKRFLSLFLAAVLVLSLAACGGTEVPPSPSPPESPASLSEAPEDVSASGPLEEPGSSPAPEPPVLTPAPGVEVRSLLTWEPGDTWVTVPFPVRGGRLLVETHTQTGQWTETGLAGFDLTTGEEFAIPLAKFDGFEYRQVLDVPGWEIKIFSETSYQRLSWTQFLDGYTLPESLWEGRKTYSGRHDWDAQPEKDLLTWTNLEGLCLAAADGSGARLVLTTGEVLKQPEFSFMEEANKDLPVEESLIFQCPRLMNGGKTIVVDFDLPGSTPGHIGLAVLDLETGKTTWFAPFSTPLWSRLEYLDDTTIQAGSIQIDVATGETKKGVARHIQVGNPHFVATTGDFSRYFACNKEDGLAVFSPAGQELETVLTSAGYKKLSLCHAVDARRVVCEYETPEEAGLLLVTLPE